MRKRSMAFILLILFFVPVSASSAEDTGANSAAEMAKKLQNPLANIKALMSDNTIAFDTGDDEGTSYGFQIQPVYAIDFPDRGFTFIPRAVIPILGLEPGTKTRLTGEDGRPSTSSSVWGIGDSILQFFFAPHTNNEWKWGVGPQISLATHTDSDLKGPKWGAGLSGVITGDITPNLSFAGLVGNHWGFDGRFSTASIQPIFFYNFESMPGSYVGYNATISADWKAKRSNLLTIPLGFSVGRTFSMGGGNGFDVSVGPYYNVVKPDGAADWMLRFGLSWVFP